MAKGKGRQGQIQGAAVVVLGLVLDSFRCTARESKWVHLVLRRAEVAAEHISIPWRSYLFEVPKIGLKTQKANLT